MTTGDERIAHLAPALNASRAAPAGQAMAEVAQVGRRLAAGKAIPLANVPIAIKDGTDAAGVPSMCGAGAHPGPVSIGFPAGPTMRPHFFACRATGIGTRRRPFSPERKSRWHTPL